MSEALAKLESKIKQLLDSMESLQAENRSFRALAGESSGTLSRQQVAERIESLRREKEKLEKKMSRLQQGISRVLDELDKLES